MWKVTLVTLAFVLVAGPGGAETLQARVVDAETGRPIEGAVVLARWASQAGTLSEVEVESDAEGRFTLDRPAGPFRENGELVVVFKFGYVVWTNTLIIQVDRPPRMGEAPPASARLQNQRVPSEIVLARFPVNGNHIWHFWSLKMIADADGRKERRPKFWNAIQLEAAEALKQTEELCRNRTDCD